MVKNRTIFTGDNLPIMRGMADDVIDLIYLDPPFNSNRNYEAPIGSEAAGASFKDAWTFEDTDDVWWGEIAEEHPALYSVIDAAGAVGGKGAKAYSIYMAVRLLEMRRILKDTGSIYLHCDPTMSHTLKLVMDAIFGKANFRNEIIWNKGFRGTEASRRYQRAHDVVFFYSKTDNYVWNDTFINYKDPALKRYNKVDERGKKYALIKRRRTDGTVYYGKTYPKSGGKRANDVVDVPVLSATTEERTGYPTQKPLALLRRIVKASSNEGDMVLDPFCGCATACIAAQDEGREWIGIDVSELAFELVQARMKKELKLHGIEVIHRPDIPQDRQGERSKNIKHLLFGKQEGICNGCKRHFPFNNFTLDHIVPLAVGGADIDENLQLLCNWCNSKKGTRSMPEFLAALKAEGLGRP